MNLSEALEMAIGALEVTADKLEKDGAWVYETRDTIADTINAALDAAEGGRMIFDALYESAQRGELLLIDGGFCHWHLRRDEQLTIREIIATRKGAGTEMLDILRGKGATSIVAKCPAHLASNGWYERMGFALDHTEQTCTGKAINVWRLSTVQMATHDLPG